MFCYFLIICAKIRFLLAVRIAVFLLLTLQLTSCFSASPVTTSGFALIQGVATGVSGGIDASRPYDERLRRRLPEHCSHFSVNDGGMMCQAYYPQAPKPFGITSSRTKQSGTNTNRHKAMEVDNNLVNCLYEARISKERSMSQC